MKKICSVLFSVAVISMLSLSAMAKEETAAVMSPKCDMKKIQEICGAACKKVEKGSFEGGFNVTLDTDKLTFAKLTEKMSKEKCM